MGGSVELSTSACQGSGIMPTLPGQRDGIECAEEVRAEAPAATLILT
jgi:hypothetical protein